MAILLNKKYKFRIDVKRTTLTYRATVTAIDSMFVTFIDDRGKEHNFNLNSIIEYSLLEDQNDKK